MNKLQSKELKLAIIIATGVHAGQVDKAGRPYINHPLRVMEAVDTDEEKQIAVLHDVIEDSPLTLEDLRFYGFSASVVEAIDALSRREGETYFDFIGRIELNPVATKVKIADLKDNMDLSRLPSVTDKDLARQAKYKRAYRRLVESLEEQTQDGSIKVEAHWEFEKIPPNKIPPATPEQTTQRIF